MLDWLMSLFGGGNKFGNIDPDDYETFWRANHEIDQAERQGPQEHQATLNKYGVKSQSQWDDVLGAFTQRHQANPDFAMAASRVMSQIHMSAMPAQYQVSAADNAPVEGVDLNRLALIEATVEYAQPSGQGAVAQALQGFGLDPAAYERIRAGWHSRMSGSANAITAATLSSQYQAFLAQARVSAKRA